MSTVRADTLATRTGAYSTSMENPVRGSAKAWVNFNGTGTPAIRTGFNVSSITDNGTGDYTINFTTALADANYAPVGAIQSAITNAHLMAVIKLGVAPTASACRVTCGAVDDNPRDPGIFSMAFFGT